MDNEWLNNARKMTLSDLRNMQNQHQLSQMTHTQSYSNDMNPLEAFDNTSESWAHGIYNAPGNLARLVESLPDYSRAPGYYSEPIDEFMGANYLNEEFTPQSGWQQTVSGAGEAAADPTMLLGLPMAVVKGAPMVKNTLKGLAQEFGTGTPISRQGGMIGGPKAQNADLDALARAQSMKAEGLPADDIYTDTQWWLDHPDGVPRFEIDDSGAKFSSDRMTWGSVKDLEQGNQRTGAALNEILTHDELAKNYDGLFDYDPITNRQTTVSLVSGKKGGSFDGDYGIEMGIEPPYQIDNTMYPPYFTETQKETGLHELQHAIQSRENMARGGSPEMFGVKKARAHAIVQEANENLSRLAPMIDHAESIGDAATAKELNEEFAQWMGNKMNVIEEFNLDPNDAYRALSGEADARLVQDRMNMSMEERLANPFYQNYDVPLEDQIIRMDESGPSQMITWQGSPHKYDGNLDPTKIGTGEGAQAYGYGHYLAEAKDTGITYRDGLSRQEHIKHDGKQWNILKDDDDLYRVEEKTYRLSPDGAVSYEDWGHIGDTQYKTPEEAFSAVRSNYNLDEGYRLNPSEDGLEYGGTVINDGYLYKFDLDDNAIANMLDWDAPLSEQPESVRNALQQTGFLTNEGNGIGWMSNPYGDDIYHYLGAKKYADDLGFNVRDVFDSKASDYERGSSYLSELGIPGLKYYDGSSRSAGEGTRNFVVFPGNEHLVKPLERNGEALGDLSAFSSQRGAVGVKDLPMDEASRMERARGMGNTTTAYHGGYKDISSLNDNEIFWASEKPSLANEYAVSNPLIEGGENVIPVMVNKGKTVSFRHAEQRKPIREVMADALNQSDVPPTGREKELWEALENKFGDEPRSLYEFWYDSPELVEYFKGLGFDSIEVAEKANMKDATIGVLSPSNVRSKFAKFDPAKKDSANLLDSRLLPIPLGLLGTQYEDNESY